MAKQELLATIRDRYRASSKKDKGRILDEFIAVTGHHRKHGIRLLGQSGDDGEQQPAAKKGRRIYDEAVRQAVIVVWEAADRICGKRLKAALPHLVESMERHGHLDLDPGVRQRLLAASAATLDRLLQPIRTPASRRLRRRRRQSPGRNIPVRTFADWNAPPPGFLEIDLVVHHGGSWWGSMIHSLVATDICTGWTEAVPLLARWTARIGLGEPMVTTKTLRQQPVFALAGRLTRSARRPPCICPGAGPGKLSSIAPWHDCEPFIFQPDGAVGNRPADLTLTHQPTQHPRYSRKTGQPASPAASCPSPRGSTPPPQTVH